MKKLNQLLAAASLTLYFSAQSSPSAVSLSAFSCPFGRSTTCYLYNQSASFMQTLDLGGRAPVHRNDLAQPDVLFNGKVVRSKGTCKWLILITDAHDATWVGKLIEPTGDFPEEFQKRGTRLRFEMTPLRQPVPEGCKADLVASVGNMTKE